MKLRRLYDLDAPKSKWIHQEEVCIPCRGKGNVLNDSGDEIISCPDCDDGIQVRIIPPVSGVEVLHTGPRQHFSPRLVEGASREGWLQLENGRLTINGSNRKLVYEVKRPPGQYEGKVINYYDCVLIEEV